MTRKSSLPPGFRFHPTDVELIKYYLKRKILGKKLHFEAIAEVDIYKHAPWDLPDKSSIQGGDLKWYFFCPRERKYASGSKMNRATKFGYWKTTGKDRPVHYNNEVVGMIKTLIFHRGRAPHGERTDWVIHEYKLDEKNLVHNGVVQDSYVLCMLFKKAGLGPRNGSQYGAPFKEEDWTDDDEENINEPNINVSTVDSIPNIHNNSVVISEHAFESSSVSNITIARPITGDAMTEKSVSEDDDIVAMLGIFREGSNDPHGHKDDGPPCIDGTDIFKDLGDLGNMAAISASDNCGSSTGQKTTYTWDRMLPTDDVPFLELIDLDTPLCCPTNLIKDGYNYYENSDPSGKGGLFN